MCQNAKRDRERDRTGSGQIVIMRAESSLRSGPRLAPASESSSKATEDFIRLFESNNNK